MPSFVLLQCYQCRIFSPNQETKNSKWACRMCGAKQSILKVHAKTDSAKDLRGIAQQLNAQQGATRSEEFVIQQSPVIASPPMYELYEGGSEEEEGGGESWNFRRGPPPQPMSGSADGYTCQSHHGVRGSDQGEREAFGGQGGSRWSAYLVEDEDGLGRGGNAVGGRGWMNVEATEEDNRLVTAIPTSRSGKEHGRGKGKGGGRGRRDEAQARAGDGIEGPGGGWRGEGWGGDRSREGGEEGAVRERAGSTRAEVGQTSTMSVGLRASRSGRGARGEGGVGGRLGEGKRSRMYEDRDGGSKRHLAAPSMSIEAGGGGGRGGLGKGGGARGEGRSRWSEFL